SRVWLLLGAISAMVAAGVWRSLRAEAVAPRPGSAAVRSSLLREWRLIAGYGAFGFGYIIPATFLPSMAREAIADPAVFGWIWPAFGATAAASTALVALFLQRVQPARLWAASLVVMAVGVLAPTLRPGVASLLVAAVCVGGTFMLATLAGMQQARRVAGVDAPRLMASTTAAFALGQLSGPVVVALTTAAGAHGTAGPSWLGAACLLAAAFAMRRGAADIPLVSLHGQGTRT
ncbi:MAG: YbfB/YjiJ family MFS transporter, partial [Caldimonas sp.]